MRKKIISAMLALCMAGSLLTGCGTSADAEKKSKDSGDCLLYTSDAADD